jgi:hypothetical protein
MVSYRLIRMFEDGLNSMYDRDKKIPMWLGGILLGLLLILLSNRGSGGLTNPVLIQRFVPRPADPSAPTAQPFQLPQVHLPSLPPAVRDSLTQLRDRFASGQGVPALTPVASGPRVKVEVTEVRRAGDHVQIKGSVANTSGAPLAIPPGAFTFRDSGGVSYSTGGSAAVTLAAGQSTTLDLGVPLPEGRGLTLILSIPPDPPLEQVLVVETRSS